MPERPDPVALVGSSVRALRTTIGWSQRELARRADVSQSTVCLVERARLEGLTFATATALVEAMGGRLAIGVDAPYLGDRQRQRDPAHARVSAYVVGRLRRAGWDVRSEVEVGGDRSRGWIDVLAVQSLTGVLLVIEIKTEIHDLGQIERSLGWYEREAWLAARQFGWRPRRQLGCLLVLATEANDVRLSANRASIDLGFPQRARDLGPIVSGVVGVAAAGRAVAFVDPRSRRRAWCGSLRIDGRRSTAPYVDYADFIRAADAVVRRTPRAETLTRSRFFKRNP